MTTRYTVVPGDMVDRIASAHGTTRSALVELNPWLLDRPKFRIFEDDVILLPGTAADNDTVAPLPQVAAAERDVTPGLIAPAVSAAASPTPAAGTERWGRGEMPMNAPAGTRWINLDGRSLWANARDERIPLEDIYALPQNRGLEQNVGRMQWNEWVLIPDENAPASGAYAEPAADADAAVVEAEAPVPVAPLAETEAAPFTRPAPFTLSGEARNEETEPVDAPPAADDAAAVTDEAPALRRINLEGRYVSQAAADYGFTTAEVLAVNPGLDPNRLQLNEDIFLPAGGPSSSPPARTSETYVVQPSDSDGPAAIAARAGITRAELARLNNRRSLNGWVILAGQSIQLPANNPLAVAQRTFEIPDGASPERIAAFAGVAVEDLEVQDGRVVLPAGSQLADVLSFLAGRRPSNEYDALATRIADEVGVPRALVKAMMSVESSGDSDARSNRNAVGLMQVTPIAARAMGGSWEEMRDDPELQLRTGSRYLRELYEVDFGHIADEQRRWTLALAAYNAGPTTVRDAGERVPNIGETRAYVRKVPLLWQYYELFPQFQRGGDNPDPQTLFGNA